MKKKGKPSKRVTKLSRPVTRMIGTLVVEIDGAGIRFRGKRKRRWREVSWAQVAALAGASEPIFRAEENARGLRQLEAIGADPDHVDEPATDQTSM